MSLDHSASFGTKGFVHAMGALFVVMLLSASAAHSGEPFAPANIGADRGTSPRSPMYSGTPNHREIAIRAFELATEAGFADSGISQLEIRNRLEAGAYSEDYDPIPGIVGVHFPTPWYQGPEFDFDGLYPFSRIPYGSLTDITSGWVRGIPHGYDPVDGFTWPGTHLTTFQWANSSGNAFSWDNAIRLYQSGKKAEAYECIGHLLHLLSDLSMPEHVKILNHGTSMTSMHSGKLWDPDLVTMVVDEYELALAGGIELPGVIKLIPDLYGVFQKALAAAGTQDIPRLSSWQDYFADLATLTFNDSLVNRYYGEPAADGQWGVFKNGRGGIVDPTRYGITPPAELGERWVQIELKSTASATSGPLVPDTDLRALCNRLVPKAAEYCAGLLLHFLRVARPTGDVRETPGGIPLADELQQNYPNPFNPETNIPYRVSRTSSVSLKVYDMLGRVVAKLVEKVQPPGSYSAHWNAGHLSGGIYFCRLRIGTHEEARKMCVSK